MDENSENAGTVSRMSFQTDSPHEESVRKSTLDRGKSAIAAFGKDGNSSKSKISKESEAHLSVGEDETVIRPETEHEDNIEPSTSLSLAGSNEEDVLWPETEYEDRMKVIKHFKDTPARLTRTSVTEELTWPETEHEDDMKFIKPFRAGPTEKNYGYYKRVASPVSNRTEYEADMLEDYMQFIIEAFKEPGTPISTISSDLSCKEQELQRTIAIIKPNAMAYKDVILRAINEAGFQIIAKRLLHLSAEQVSEIYAKYYGSPSFPHLVISGCAEPVLAISMAAVGAVSRWRNMVGPDGSLKEDWFYPLSVRKRFGRLRTLPDVLHASETVREADRENRYFYPDSILEPLLHDGERVEDFINQYVAPTLTKGLAQVAKTKPLDPIMFLADWLLLNNPYQPRMPYYIAAAPT